MSDRKGKQAQGWPVAPLEGLRVLDFSRFIAGPHCSMLLAELGAEVVKVEKINGGDDARSLGHKIGEESLYTHAFNRNKRSIALDFRTDAAKATIHDLAAKADVLVENFRPGTLEAMGCSPEILQKINPQLIIARVSGFGQTGPWSHQPCFDAIAQALSGLMSITGQPDGPPTLSGTFLVDYGASLYATIAVFSALEVRRRTGRGAVLDISLLETAATFLVTGIPEQLRLGETMSRIGSRDRFGAPANTYRTADGDWVLIVIPNQSLFVRLTAAMQRPDLLQNPHFITNAKRLEHLAEVDATVEDWTSGLSTARVLELMNEHGIPAAKVSSIADVVENPQLIARKFFLQMETEDIGTVPLASLPFQLDGFRPASGRSAPRLGEHGAEILEEWLREP